jgi:murein L,D-transpeptidase YcbB/YkuD
MTSAIDQTIKEMVADLEDVHTDYAKAEVGEMVFFSDYSHVMTVSKYGEKDIESAPSLDGVKEVSLFYQPSSRVGGAGKLPWVEYDEKPKEDDEVKYSDLEICRKGSKGDAVRTIQANVHVYVDGVFGSDTEKSVKEYQKKKGLVADGVVGQRTWKSIIEGWSK